MKSSLFLLLLAAAAVMVSCKKQELAKNDVIVPEASSFKDLKVSPAFDWSTTSEITVNIIPLATPVPITNTLVVKTEDGDVLFSKLQTMGDAFSDRILVPSTITKLVVSFGTITATKTISNNQISFDYLVN